MTHQQLIIKVITAHRAPGGRHTTRPSSSSSSGGRPIMSSRGRSPHVRMQHGQRVCGTWWRGVAGGLPLQPPCARLSHEAAVPWVLQPPPGHQCMQQAHTPWTLQPPPGPQCTPCPRMLAHPGAAGSCRRVLQPPPGTAWCRRRLVLHLHLGTAWCRRPRRRRHLRTTPSPSAIPPPPHTHTLWAARGLVHTPNRGPPCGLPAAPLAARWSRLM